MFRHLWLAVGCLLSTAVMAAPPIGQYANDFHQLFMQRAAQTKVPGAVYVIVKDDRIIKVGAYGVRVAGTKAAVDANTTFRLASVSKTFAGALTAQAAHEGRFSLQDRVSQYVPGLKFRSPAMTAQLKVEHLMAQSAGLSDNAFDDLIEANQTPAQILPKFANINPRCQPGRCYGYQNVLFSQIETVLLKTTGKTYEQLINSRFFTPLQMHTASVGYSGFLASKNRAMPHIRTKRGWAETKVLPTYYRVNPAAGVNASAMDLGKWLIARLGHAPAVLSPAMLHDIHQPRIKTSDNLAGRSFGPYVTTAHYGLGVRIYQFGDNILYFHGGAVRGYRTVLSYSTEKGLGLAVLVNAESDFVSEMAGQFWATMLDGQAAVPLTPAASRQKAKQRQQAVSGQKKVVKKAKKPVKKKAVKKKVVKKKAVKKVQKKPAVKKTATKKPVQ